MKFKVSYKKKEEFEIKELSIDLEFSEGNKTDYPATSLVKAVVKGMIVFAVIATALAVYGAEHGQPMLLGFADKLLEIPHYFIDRGKDLVILFQEKK